MSQQTNGEVHRHYIGGEWTTGSDDETLASTDPATGETVGTFSRTSTADVDNALESAADAFESWRDLSYIDRVEYL